MSLQSGMQDREHKFRPVLLGTGEVSEITHSTVCSSTRKSFERKASKCVSRTHKILHPPPKKREESRVQTCHRNFDHSFKCLQCFYKTWFGKGCMLAVKSYIYNFFIVAGCSCRCQDIIFYPQNSVYVCMVLKFCTVVSYQTVHCLYIFSCQNAFCVPGKWNISYFNHFE